LKISASLRLNISLLSLCLCGKNAFVLQLQKRHRTNGTAVAVGEPSAENAPIQRHAPSYPPTQIVNSADISERPAGQFGGKYAQSAKFANLVHVSHDFF
jgi:hypothetical protein